MQGIIAIKGRLLSFNVLMGIIARLSVIILIGAVLGIHRVSIVMIRETVLSVQLAIFVLQVLTNGHAFLAPTTPTLAEASYGTLAPYVQQVLHAPNTARPPAPASHAVKAITAQKELSTPSSTHAQQGPILTQQV